jgi:predicted alpha-1,2-mannosidase
VHPGYYAVTLSGPQVRAEMTATDLAAYHRWTPVSATPGHVTVVIDVSHTLLSGYVLDGGVEVRPSTREVRVWAKNNGGFSTAFGGMPIYHAVHFRSDPVAWGTWSNGVLAPSVATQSGHLSGAWLEFDVSDGSPIEFQVGVSYTDLDGAAANLQHDLAGWDFDAVRADASADWETQLSTIAVDGGTPAQRTVMATALYHAFLMPNRFSDADSRYVGFDRSVHDAGTDLYYTNFSLWDTYRTLHPLLMLVQPLRQRDMLRSLVLMALQGGFIPKWPFGIGETNVMIGSPGDMVVSESWLKGIRDFDVEAAYTAMRAIATAPTPAGSQYQGRVDVQDYLALGYVPADRDDQSVSKTQEYAIADFALAGLAKGLGKDADATMFAAHAKFPWNLWSDDQKLFVPRDADGTWIAVPDPTLIQEGGTGQPYTEGNALQYRWLIPHDAVTLRDRMGGAAAMQAALDDFFQGAVVELAAMPDPADSDPIWWMTHPPTHYWQGNEPDIHAAYMYLYAQRPDLAQKWIHWIQDTLFTAAANGIPGNDDCGTMSAWWIFSALGFYPLGGTDLYLVGSPTFPHAVLDLGGGKTLIVDAPAAGPDAIYVKSVTLNGTALDKPSFRHADIAAGGTLHFEMSATPTGWGTAGPDVP